MADRPPAGWMDDPEKPDGERYWDGQAWTEHRRARWRPPASPPPSQRPWWMSPWVVIPAVLLLLVFAVLADQNDGSGPEPRAPAAAPEEASEERYIDFIRDEIPGAAGRSDSELVSGGRQMCSNLDRGMTVEEIAQASVILGLNLEEVGIALVGARSTRSVRSTAASSSEGWAAPRARRWSRIRPPRTRHRRRMSDTSRVSVSRAVR